jgi:hypothetical protein
MTCFIRILQAPVDAKQAELLNALTGLKQSVPQQQTIFDRAPDTFAAVPGSPFAYWVSDKVLRTFKRFPPFESNGCVAKGGMKTQADERFLRASWEVSDSATWVGLCKGGRFSRFYSDVHLVTEWRQGGKQPRAAYEHKVKGESWGGFGRNEVFYFRPGITWPRRTNGLSFRVMPQGCIFGDKGPAAFVDDDRPDRLLALCALANSVVFGYLLAVQLARTELAQSFEVGLVQQTPIPNLARKELGDLAQLGRRAWSFKRSLDTTNETSRAFLLPPGLNERITEFHPPAIERELQLIQEQIDDVAFELYGIVPEDKVAIAASLRGTASSDTSDAGTGDEGDNTSEDEESTEAGTDALNSWLVGVTFGRFDPRLATGERPIPSEPEPFDPLPPRSPGMWPEGEEPIDRLDILIDDEGHVNDLVARMRAVAERVRVEAPENLRVWLTEEFFRLHIRMYSKSRRKAPIYWQLSTESASYSVWLYVHAFSKDTLFRVQNDYAVLKLAHEERRLELMTRELRDKAPAAQRKELAAQETFVEELRAFVEEVKRVAPLWKPNLDDGVIINFALLWRLVPQHKSWQKELKSTWDALCEGKYDWAHLAMHLWPERVAPKCAKDRSLAIAHGLEDVFWVEGSDGKWTARKASTRSIEELVRERTSPAVKSALKNLLEAPAVTGNGGRGRAGRRQSAAAAEGEV